MRLLRRSPSLLRPFARSIGIVEIHLALCNASLQLIQLGVKYTHLPKVAPFKDFQPRTHLGQLCLSLRKPHTNSRKFFPLIAKNRLVRTLLEDDFRWHKPTRQ
jgi:hypothetical protein